MRMCEHEDALSSHIVDNKFLDIRIHDGYHFGRGKYTLLSFSKGILTIIDFLGDLLGDFFFFLPNGNLTMSFSAFLLGDFLLGDFFLGDFFLGRRIRSGGTF
jgi:hypothetical protein